MQSPDEWVRNYQVNSRTELILDEPFDANHTDGASLTSGNATLSTKGTFAKTTRRRSCASNKVPTTLLNASASDFRAVVQKYTGYHSAPPALGNCKGPINLNFSQYNSPSEWPYEAHQQLQERREADRKLFSFGANNSITTSNIDLFVPSESYNHRPAYPLSFDDLDIDTFSMAGPGDHSR